MEGNWIETKESGTQSAWLLYTPDLSPARVEITEERVRSSDGQTQQADFSARCLSQEHGVWLAETRRPDQDPLALYSLRLTSFRFYGSDGALLLEDTVPRPGVQVISQSGS